MKRLHVIVAASCSLAVLGAVGWWMWPSWHGAHVARSDLAAGRPRYMLYGELAPFEEQAIQRIAEDHGVDVHRIAFCVVSRGDVDWADAYNAVVCGELGLDRNIFGKVCGELIEQHR